MRLHSIQDLPKFRLSTLIRPFALTIAISHSAMPAEPPPLCGVPKPINKSTVKRYCEAFGLQFSSPREIEFACLKGSQVICNVWETQSPVQELIAKGKLSPTYFEDKKNILPQLRSALIEGRQTLAPYQIIGYLDIHPFAPELKKSVAGQRLLDHAYQMNDFNGGRSISWEKYIQFMENHDPFHSLIVGLPDFMNVSTFWNRLNELAIDYEASIETRQVKIDQVLLEEALMKLKQEFFEPFFSRDQAPRPYLLYPIVSAINVPNSKTNIRFMLYYEELRKGKKWGRSMIIPFNPSTSEAVEPKSPPRNSYLLAQANFDLSDAGANSFLFDQNLIFHPSEAKAVKNKSKSIENCQSCHLEINNMKIGSPELFPKNETLRNDYQKALALSAPITHDGMTPKEFSYLGEPHFFPHTLRGTSIHTSASVKLKVLNFKALGPMIGSETSIESLGCFNGYPSKAEAINCYGCHNNHTKQQGAIYWVNYVEMLRRVKKWAVSAQQHTQSKDTFLRKLLSELQMPYAQVELTDTPSLSRSHPMLSPEDVLRLTNCLKENFPKDYIDWISQQLKEAIKN